MADLNNTSISRRNLLKILSAAGGAVALANLPIHWMKPAVKMGLLPAHAQSSSPYVLTAAADLDWVTFCFNLMSSATIAPVAAGIGLAYTITTTGSAAYTVPASATGTLTTDAAGSVSLTITPSTASLVPDDRIIVTWSFVNPADGTNSDAQYFNNSNSGC
jgi:hypothetical protein